MYYYEPLEKKIAKIISRSNMVTPGSLKYTPGKMSKGESAAMASILVIYSVVGGYLAGTQPSGAGWRLFSWHPFLMMVGMVGCLGSAAIIKKIGGYTNTKIHGILSWIGVFCSIGGMYAIYLNKENNGAQHFKSSHGKAGLALLLSCLGLGLVGGIVLHPDFGIDKTNKNIRAIHKFSARFIILLSWINSFVGLYTLTHDNIALMMFTLPLLLMFPLTLM